MSYRRFSFGIMRASREEGAALRLIGHSVSDASGTILAMDAAALDVLQRSRRETIGISYLELTHAADRKRNAILVDRLPSDATPIEIRKRYITPDGDTVEVDVQVSRLSAGADVGRLVGSLYHVAPEDALHTPDLLWQAARRLTQWHDLRRDLFGVDIFGDHALAILLQLYLDEAEGRASLIQTVAALIDLPISAAGRWFRALDSKGLVDVADGGAVQLTTIGARKLTRLLTANSD